jgi:predicted nucleic acid-binding protein
MRAIFIDTNVLYDVLGRRETFYGPSNAVWSLCEKGKIKGFISVISFNNVYYINRRMTNRSNAIDKISLIRDVFSMVALDEQVINQAIDSDFSDFEDAIQYFSAVRCDAECIVTRNKKDFKLSDIAVLSPEEFLSINEF